MPSLPGILSYIAYGKHIARGIPTSEMQNLQSPTVNWATLPASTARIQKIFVKMQDTQKKCCETADHAVKNCFILTCSTVRNDYVLAKQ